MSTVAFKCPNCGGPLSFDAAKQKFSCEFCISDFDESELKDMGADKASKEEARTQKEFEDHIKEYNCPNCGAVVVTDDDTAASFCYYCHSPVVVSDKLSGNLKPDKIIPFKYSKEDAKKKFLKFARKKLFVPKSFTYPEQIEKITGLYLPFWVTDADTFCTMDATATNVRVWVTGKMQYTETSKYFVTRRANVHFEDIVISATDNENKDMVEGILPYPSDSLIDFKMLYLSGYQAKKRNIDKDSVSVEVKDLMKDYATTILSQTVQGYNRVSDKNVNVKIEKSHREYALMPIWILTYRKDTNKKRAKGKSSRADGIYTYAMNGETGKIYGELPIDYKKIGILFASVCAFATVVCSLLGGMMF